MKLFLPVILICLWSISWSQELNCRVIVDHTQVQISDPSIFDDMETDFSEFINNRKWTDDEFQLEERINCNLLLTITASPSVGFFEATAQIISSRPVFGTEYETVVLNFADRDWSFQYVPSRPINYNENSFTDNVSSLLAYYAFVIIGMDYDTFGEMSGDKYFQRATQIVNIAQQSNFPGWQQLGSNRNRFWLIENLQNGALEPIRRATYAYHRHGLDIFREEPDEARDVIVESLQKIQTANRTRPRSILTITFMDAKATELANLYSDGNPTVRKKAFGILTSIDPSKTDIFKAMVE